MVYVRSMYSDGFGAMCLKKKRGERGDNFVTCEKWERIYEGMHIYVYIYRIMRSINYCV